VLLDVDAWVPDAGRAGDRPGPVHPAEAARLLVAAGWSVTVAGPDQPLRVVWDRLCADSAPRLGATR
jgi:hypothetical protein